MNARTTGLSPSERGFSLIEVLAVMGIIAVMAGVALPSIATYIRNYKINGAEREVSSELSSTRSRAISKNTQAGVSFMVVDANSYRFIVEDGATTLGPLHDLPIGVVFLPPAAPFPPGAGGAGFAVRFNRLGASCPTWTTGLSCVQSLPVVLDPTCPTGEAARCSDGPGLDYLDVDADGRSVDVGLFETNSGLRKLIRIEPGGRVRTVSQ